MDDYYKKYIENEIMKSRETIKSDMVDGKNPYTELVTMTIEVLKIEKDLLTEMIKFVYGELEEQKNRTI